MKSYKEKAAKDAEKRVKKFDALQRKAMSSAKREHEKLMKNREKMERNGGMTGSSHIINDSGIPLDVPQQMVAGQKPHHHSLVPSILSLRRDSGKGQQSASGSHSFSALTSSTHSSTKGKSGGLHAGVSKKILQRKTLSSAKATGSDFKVIFFEIKIHSLSLKPLKYAIVRGLNTLRFFECFRVYLNRFEEKDRK